MSMKVCKDFTTAHPLLVECHKKINEEVILKHNAPFRLFETGREHDRHQTLLMKGRTKDVMSRHLFNLENDPPLYTTAMDYVYFNGQWSWNLRNAVVYHWYLLFGYMVLEVCPELCWGGLDRRSSNYNHFFLRRESIIEHLDICPCVVP